MRISSSFVMLVLFVLPGPVLAGVPAPRGCFPNEYPCPGRCTVLVVGQGGACQFRFRTDGGLDRLTVLVTLRDAFDNPVPDCSTSVGLRPTSGTLALCTCGPSSQGGISDSSGALALVFSRIGGRGQLEVSLTTNCRIRNFNWFAETVSFTSPDLDGSCEETGSVGVLDLGLWAGALPPGPYRVWADYDCSGGVSVVDLGYWAGGLGLECGAGPGPALTLYRANATMEDTVIRDNPATDHTVSAALAISGGTTTIRGCEIRGNLLSNPGSSAASAQSGGLSGGATTVFDSSTIENNGGLVRLYGSPGAVTSYTLRDCTIRDEGVRASGGGLNVVMERCVIEGGRVGFWGSVYHPPPDFCEIRDCVIRDNTSSGIEMNFSNVTVEGCEIRGNGARGLYAGSANDVTIRDCVVTGNGSRGIYLQNCVAEAERSFSPDR